MPSPARIEFAATQLGMQMRVGLRLDDLMITTFEIDASDFVRLVKALSPPPVVTITHGEPNDEQLSLF